MLESSLLLPPSFAYVRRIEAPPLHVDPTIEGGFKQFAQLATRFELEAGELFPRPVARVEMSGLVIAQLWQRIRPSCYRRPRSAEREAEATTQ